MDKRIQQFAVTLATILVLLANYLAAEGFINGTLPNQISDRYSTVITPSGYAFAIWGLIYFGLIAFSIYQALPSQRESELISGIRVPYLFLSALNIGWLFAWHYELVPLSLLVIVFLLICLSFICQRIAGAASTEDVCLVKAPLSFYFGWVTAATFLNLAVALVYGGFTFAASSAAFGVCAVAVITAIGVIVRFRINSMAYVFPLAWAVTAIGVKQSGNTLVVVATAISLMVLIFFAFWGFIKDK
ncbi:MAG: hypothetical protein HKN33_05140 [Pyrinomonadaceae bacterium]|nr:hypothetical protein [Pyrinomonadaceae bacterium]